MSTSEEQPDPTETREGPPDEQMHKTPLDVPEMKERAKQADEGPGDEGDEEEGG